MEPNGETERTDTLWASFIQAGGTKLACSGWGRAEFPVTVFVGLLPLDCPLQLHLKSMFGEM